MEAKDKIEVKVPGGKEAKAETEVEVRGKSEVKVAIEMEVAAEEAPFGKGGVGIMIVTEDQILREEGEVQLTEEIENFQVIEEEMKEMGLHTEIQYHRGSEVGEALLGMLTEDEKSKNQEINLAVVTVVLVAILAPLVMTIEGNTGKNHLAQVLMNLKVKTR